MVAEENSQTPVYQITFPATHHKDDRAIMYLKAHCNQSQQVEDYIYVGQVFFVATRHPGEIFKFLSKMEALFFINMVSGNTEPTGRLPRAAWDFLLKHVDFRPRAKSAEKDINL